MNAFSIATGLTCAALLGCGTSSDEPAPPGGTGGVSAAGGSSGTGGDVGTGGVAASGGSAGTGGTTASGGSAGAGGNAGTGGTGGTGGSDATGGSGGDPPDAAPSGATRAIESPPTYMGSVNNGAACSKQYITSGFEPDDAPGTRHPLFLYFTGTNFTLTEVAFREQAAPGVDAVTEAMARRGFVALWVEYDNGALAWLSDHLNQLECLFGDSHAQSVLAVACALPQVDCDLGIAMWGHSQGAYIAHRAANYDDRMRAAWLAGYGGDGQSILDQTRLRVVNGQNDTTNGTVPVVNQIAGFTTAECPDDGRSECLRDDGSGWIIVRPGDCQTSTADHCWFDRVTCTDANPTLEPNWIDPDSTKAFALEPNADWVAETARRL